MSKDGEVSKSMEKEKACKDQEELLQSKTAAIYKLTVELGCLREENNELKSNVKMQQVDFSDRFNEQRKRLDEEYCKLQEEFEYYKIESQDAFKDSQTTIIEYSDKIKELEGQYGTQIKLMNDQNGKHHDDLVELNNQLEQLQQILQKKDTECQKLKQASDLQQQEVDLLVASNKIMQSQLEKMQEQLGNQKRPNKDVAQKDQLLDESQEVMQEAEVRRQNERVIVGDLDGDAGLYQPDSQNLVKLQENGNCEEKDVYQQRSKPFNESKQLMPTQNASDRRKHLNEDQHQRARILESPNSSKVADFQADNDKQNRIVSHQTSEPQKRELQSRMLSNQQISQEQRMAAFQLTEPIGADSRRLQGAHPWLPSRGPGASQEDASGACPSAHSGRGGETAQYNPVDTPLGSQGHKFYENLKGAAGGHLYDGDSPQRFGGLHLCHSLGGGSSPGEDQFTPFNQAQEDGEQSLLMFGNREQREVDRLECSQPLAAEHIPKRASKVELDPSLWERDDGLIATAKCEEDLMLQQQTGEFTETPFDLNMPRDQKEINQCQWNSGAAVGTNSLPEDSSETQKPQTQVTSAAAGGISRLASKKKAQADNYSSKTSTIINRANNKSSAGNASKKNSPSGRKETQSLSKERSRSKSGRRDTNALKSSSRAQCASTGSNRQFTGPEQPTKGEGVSPDVNYTQVMPASQKSNATPLTNASSVVDHKLKKTINSRSGQQKEVRPSASGGVSGGPTGPLGVGSRLVAQRRKQQSTAGAILAEMAPKRPSRVVAGPSFISGNRGSTNPKTTAKQRLGITQNTQLNSSCSQSSQRNSVVDTLNYRSKGLQSSSGQVSKGGPGGGHTIASRAKALPAATRVLSREISQGEFGATTNFSQNFQTARQFLSRSPRPQGLRSSASFGRMLARESLQSRDQLLERARQQTPHLQMSSGLESPSQLRGCRGLATLDQQAQTDRGDPFTDASNRMTTQMSAQEAGIGDQGEAVSDNNDHMGYGKAINQGRGLVQVAVKALAASTQNPKTLKNLQGHEGISSQSNQMSSENERGGRNANCATSRVHNSGIALLPAANPGCLTSRAGGDHADDDQTKENMTDMRQKLQSIQTGKAYLEKKIQEYEARLQQMKIKKDKSEKSRGSQMMAPSATQSHRGLVPNTHGAGMHTSRPHLRDSSKLYQL